MSHHGNTYTPPARPSHDAAQGPAPDPASGPSSPAVVDSAGLTSPVPPAAPTRPRALSFASEGGDASPPRIQKQDIKPPRVRFGGSAIHHPTAYTGGRPSDGPVSHCEHHPDNEEGYLYLYCYMCSRRFLYANDWRLHQSSHANSATPFPYFNDSFAQDYQTFTPQYDDDGNRVLHVSRVEFSMYCITALIALLLLYAVIPQDLPSLGFD